MAAHRKVCPLEMVWCKHGCDVQIARKDQEKHDQEKMQNHLAMTKTELTATKDRVNVLEALLFQFIGKKGLGEGYGVSTVNSQWSIQLHLASLNAGTHPIVPVVVKMKEYSKMKRQKEQWCFKIIYTSNRGYSLCLSVHASGSREGNNNHLSVYLYLMKGPYDKELAWPFSGKM